MANDSILKQRVKPVEEIQLSTPDVTLVDNSPSASASAGAVSSALMNVGVALHQADQKKKKVEADRINQISKENLETSTKVSKFQTKDKIASVMSSLESNMPNFYEDQEAFHLGVKEANNEMSTSINDSALNEGDKAELIFHLNNETRTLNDNFFKDSTKHIKKKNGTDLEILQGSQSNNIMREVARNNFGNMETYLDDFVATAELRHKNNPSGYTAKQMNSDVTKMSANIMEAHVFGQVEDMRTRHDLNTLKGVSDMKVELAAYEESLRGSGWEEATEEIFGNYAINGKVIKKELITEVNKLMVKERTMLNNKEKSIENVRKVDRIKIKNETADFMTKVNGGLPVTKETIAENGGMIYANAKLGANVTTNEEGLDMLKVRNERSSMYTVKEMKAMQQIYKDQGYNEDIDASMDFVDKEYAIKSNGEVDEYWDDQFWLDMEEASGGAIDKTSYETYKKQDKNMLEILRVNQKISGTDTSLVDMLDITTAFRPWFTAEKSDAFGQETAQYNKALEDIENYGGQISRATSNMINNVALGNFLESMNPVQTDKFERMTVEEQEESIAKYYNNTNNKAKLYEQSRTIQKMYLGDNTVKVLNNGTAVIVPMKYENTDLNVELSKAKTQDLILPNGTMLNKSYYDAVTVGGVRAKGLEIGVTEEIEDGFVIKYGAKPLSVIIDGKKVPATLENLNILNERNAIETEGQVIETGERVLNDIQGLRNGEDSSQIDTDLENLTKYGGSYIRGEGERQVNSYYGARQDMVKDQENLNLGGVSEDEFEDLANGIKKEGDIRKRGGAQVNKLDEQIKEHMIKREGQVNKTYRDSLGKPTGGIGHLMSKAELKKYPVGTAIPEKQVNKWFIQDTAKAKRSAIKQAKEIGVNTDNFITALTSVNFQLGIGWTKKFPRAYKYLKQGKYEKAIGEIEGTLWDRQTPVRVNDFVDAIKKLQNVI